MQKYLPIDIGFEFKTSVRDMVSLRWKDGGIVVDFFIPHDPENIIRVEFDKTLVVRVLHEMPLSTEEPLGEGFVPEHFAYRVTGTRFWDSQSPVIPHVWKSAEHYRFITGWTCLDVIAIEVPRISVIPSSVTKHASS
jgi:hypothetical protein